MPQWEGEPSLNKYLCYSLIAQFNHRIYEQFLIKTGFYKMINLLICDSKGIHVTFTCFKGIKVHYIMQSNGPNCSVVGAQAQNQSTCTLAPGWPRIDGPGKMRAILKAMQYKFPGLIRIKLVNIESWFSNRYRGLGFETLFVPKSPP